MDEIKYEVGCVANSPEQVCETLNLEVGQRFVVNTVEVKPIDGLKNAFGG